MNKIVLKYCFICLVLFGFVITANGEMYHWTDENGVKHYSNRMPPSEHLQDATQLEESFGDKSNYQPPLPENNHDATKLWGEQYKEVTPKEIETFGNKLLLKRVKMTCRFYVLSDNWLKHFRLKYDQYVGIVVLDSDDFFFHYVFANKKKYGQALLQKKSGDILRLIGKIERVRGEYIFMVDEIHE